MARFGARLQAERRDEYAEGYVRYDQLKQALRGGGQASASPSSSSPSSAAKPQPPQAPPSTQEFELLLQQEIKRVHAYWLRAKQGLFDRLGQLESKWANVRQWKSSGFSGSDSMVEETYAAVLEFLQDVDFFIDFTTLNVLGVQKLVKKFERHVGGPSQLIKTLTQKDSDELNQMSDVQHVEQLAKRSRAVFAQVQKLRHAGAGGGAVTEIPFQTRPASGSDSDYNTLSRSSPASSSASEVGVPVPAPPLTLLDQLALPLLASEHQDDVWDARWPVGVAVGGSLLAGVGAGAFWTVCEVLLTPTQTALGLLLCSLGAITGTRLMGFSKYQFMFLSALAGGALGSYVFAYTGMPLDQHSERLLLAAWLVGNMLGAWTAHLPRQFVLKTASAGSAARRSAVSLAPLVGSCLGSGLLLLFQLDVGVFALLYALAWVGFSIVLACCVSRTPPRQDYDDAASESAAAAAVDEEAQQIHHSANYWKRASQSVFRLGVLGSVFVDRTVRTLVLLEVVSFYPALWGEDFFLLSVGSLLAAALGTRVPASISSLCAAGTMFVVGGPGFCSWVWVEASCRSDMAKCTFADAKHIELVVCMADILAAVLFLLELSYLQSPNDQPGPWSTLDFGSMVLLLASSVGRWIAYKL